jgi:hypothetical protein
MLTHFFWQLFLKMFFLNTDFQLFVIMYHLHDQCIGNNRYGFNFDDIFTKIRYIKNDANKAEYRHQNVCKKG